MKDYISIQCLGKLSVYAPYKVYDDNEWLAIVYQLEGGKHPEMFDLNIWLDDDTNKWCWAMYPLVTDDQGVTSTDTTNYVASGPAKEVYNIEHEP